MKIFIQPEGHSFRLMCADGRMSCMPAGQRLFRAPPLPDVQFSHDLFADAVKDARILQQYVDQANDDSKGRR